MTHDLPITSKQYHDEIRSLAKEALKQPEGTDISDWMHETIDGHEFVIYTAKAWAVCWHSQNDEAGWEESVLARNPGGWGDIMSPCAYYAMVADVWEAIRLLQVEA